MKNKRNRNKRKVTNNSIWRSYSDMMSGLLMLFILIMAIFLMQAQKNYTEKLAEQAKQLKTQNELEAAQQQVDEQQKTLSEQESELAMQQTAIAEQEKELAEQESELTSQKMTLAEQAKMLEELQKTLEDKQLDLTQKESEVKEANELIAQKESELKENQDALDEANEDLMTNQIILEESQEKLDEANELMESQQKRIDQIIGVKADLIDELNNEFQNADVNVQIDKNTGAILLDASVLYEFGKDELTEDGRHILEEVLPVYCKVLLDGNHAEDIAEIIIDGYTDSVGSYESNMKLSQERAYAVAMYLLNETAKLLTDDELEMLQSKLSVNGKASSNPILDENNREDAEASRRVEIKFRLKDEEMISELQSLIEEGQKKTREAMGIEEPAETEMTEEVIPETESEYSYEYSDEYLDTEDIDEIEIASETVTEIENAGDIIDNVKESIVIED